MKRHKVLKQRKPPHLKNRKPLESLQTFRHLKRHMSQLIYVIMGDYFYDPNWKWNWHVSLLLFGIAITSTFLVVDGYKSRNDWFHLVNVGCLIPYTMMGFERALLAHSVRKTFSNMFIDLEKFIKKWEQDKEISSILLWYCRFLKKFVFGCSAFFLVSCFFIMIGPILYYIIFGKMEIVGQLIIPGLDYRSHPGFEAHVALHGWATFVMTTGFSVFINSMVISLALGCAQVDIIMKKQGLLSELLEKDEKNDKKVGNSLREIYMLHQGMLELVDTIEQLWSIQQCSDHVIFAAQIILVLYILLQKIWLLGFFIISVAILIVFTIDLLGTIIEVKLDKLTIETYNIPWYLLSLKDKKDYYYFFGNTQKTARLTLRRGVPLNLDTFVRFCKGIYSYLMVLREAT